MLQQLVSHHVKTPELLLGLSRLIGNCGFRGLVQIYMSNTDPRDSLCRLLLGHRD